MMGKKKKKKVSMQHHLIQKHNQNSNKKQNQVQQPKLVKKYPLRRAGHSLWAEKEGEQGLCE